MRVVSNTSPISNLAIIGRLSLLQQRYGRVLVPPEVALELSALTHPAGSDAIRIAIEQEWLAVVPVPNPDLATKLREALDPGEAEAIALAVAQDADLLLLDERRGRVIARAHHLKVAGVLGELLHARISGQLASVRAEIQKLRSDARFFIGADIEVFICSQAGE